VSSDLIGGQSPNAARAATARLRRASAQLLLVTAFAMERWNRPARSGIITSYGNRGVIPRRKCRAELRVRLCRPLSEVVH